MGRAVLPWELPEGTEECYEKSQIEANAPACKLYYITLLVILSMSSNINTKEVNFMTHC